MIISSTSVKHFTPTKNRTVGKIQPQIFHFIAALVFAFPSFGGNFFLIVKLLQVIRMSVNSSELYLMFSNNTKYFKIVFLYIAYFDVALTSPSQVLDIASSSADRLADSAEMMPATTPKILNQIKYC